MCALTQFLISNFRVVSFGKVTNNNQQKGKNEIIINKNDIKRN